MDQMAMSLMRLMQFALLATMILFFALLSRWPDRLVHVVFCDVGQGDAILIYSQFTQLLIDSGPDQKVNECLQRYMPLGDQTIEVAIATHPDKDHIGGFPAVFGRYNVSHFFLLGVGKNTQDFSTFRQAVIKATSQGTSLHLGHSGSQVILAGKFTLTLVYPTEKIGYIELFSSQLTETQLLDVYSAQEKEYSSVNDVSIASFLDVGVFRHLLMADVEKSGELALTRSQVLTKIDILKAGHHGSNTSSTLELLEQTQPEYVVISAGKNNRYGHPHPDVLKRLNLFSSSILRTDLQGTIEWISDGQEAKWKTEQLHN
jgi:competence protein ComEC